MYIHIWKRLAAILLIALMLLTLFAACKKSTSSAKKIVGTWKVTGTTEAGSGYYGSYVTFGKDGSYEWAYNNGIVIESGTYSVKNNTMTINGKTKTITRSIKFIGNDKLEWGFGTGPYTLIRVN